MTETITVHADPIECEVDAAPALCLAWYDYGYWLPTQWKCVIKATRKIVFAEHMRITVKDNWTSGVGARGLPPGVLRQIDPAEAVTSMDKFSDADHGERWAKYNKPNLDHMHLSDEDGA